MANNNNFHSILHILINTKIALMIPMIVPHSNLIHLKFFILNPPFSILRGYNCYTKSSFVNVSKEISPLSFATCNVPDSLQKALIV